MKNNKFDSTGKYITIGGTVAILIAFIYISMIFHIYFTMLMASIVIIALSTFMVLKQDIKVSKIKEDNIKQNQNDIRDLIDEAFKDKNDLLNKLNNICETCDDIQNTDNKNIGLLIKQADIIQKSVIMMNVNRTETALLNESRFFVPEVKSGKKVRITRDDVAGIVVENLMDDEGVIVLKSKMYNYENSKLMLEVENDDIGRMNKSVSYDDDGNETHILYNKNGEIISQNYFYKNERSKSTS